MTEIDALRIFRVLILIVFSVAYIGLAHAQSIDDVPADFDYCPEFERSAENPYGLRECNAGCIEETEFTFDGGVQAINKNADDFWAESTEGGDEWEQDIERHANMVISLGAIYRLRLLLAHQKLLAKKGSEAAQSELEDIRGQYCEFLRTASYLD